MPPTRTPATMQSVTPPMHDGVQAETTVELWAAESANGAWTPEPA